jgi:ribosomal-protein-alanine N-acetyltransferase
VPLGSAHVTQSPRLQLRELDERDAANVLVLVNDPDFLRHIGDKGVRSLDDALAYLRDGPQASYAAHGFGLWAVEDRADGAWLGMSGLLRRDWLEAPDLGYAFLPAARGRGVAREAAEAVLALARPRFGADTVLAIVNPENAPSIRLLERVGFVEEGMVQPPGESRSIARYAWRGFSK